MSLLTLLNARKQPGLNLLLPATASMMNITVPVIVVSAFVPPPDASNAAPAPSPNISAAASLFATF